QRQGAPAEHRGRRPAAVWRHACRAHRRDRHHRGHQDREQGQDESPRQPRLRRRRVMTYANPQSLVSTAWLAEHLHQPDLRIVDGTWYLPSQGKDAKAEYLQRHVPGAVFFDIDDVSDTNSSLPHMLPPPEKFASRVRKMGIGDGLRIVVYDANNMSAA